MWVLVNILEQDYERVVHGSRMPIARVRDAIRNGTILPKGYGRLFDERDIVNGNYEIIGNRIYELEPVIEADKENNSIVENNGEGKELFLDRINH